ncbi:MAG: hypothetical protein KKE10_02215 [Proteobacteria bacterium]|nr:hypothetical protein [Pseudomonadota bacterium]
MAFIVAFNTGVIGMRHLIHLYMALATGQAPVIRLGILFFINMKDFQPISFFYSNQARILVTGKASVTVAAISPRGYRAKYSEKYGQ